MRKWADVPTPATHSEKMSAVCEMYHDWAETLGMCPMSLVGHGPSHSRYDASQPTGPSIPTGACRCRRCWTSYPASNSHQGLPPFAGDPGGSICAPLDVVDAFVAAVGRQCNSDRPFLVECLIPESLDLPDDKFREAFHIRADAGNRMARVIRGPSIFAWDAAKKRRAKISIVWLTNLPFIAACCLAI